MIAIRPALTSLFAASVVATIVLFAAAPVGAQEGVRVLGSGGSDDLVPPPSPTCSDLVFITEVSFDAAGNPIDIPRFGSTPDLVQVFDVPGFDPVGPGNLRLDEVIVYDGHVGRDVWASQLEEQVWFEFLLGGVQQARTPNTPDLPDGQRTGWHDLDMGSYELPNGADTLRIRHVGGSSVNSLVVSALCGRLVPLGDDVVETTVAPTTTVPNTIVATTAVATTAPTATTVPTTEISTEVQGQVEEVTELAITGRNEQFALGFALLSLALGILLVAVAAAERPREA